MHLFFFNLYKEGDTPLNLAIKKPTLRPDNQMYNVVDQLLLWGADPTHKDLVGVNDIYNKSKTDAIYQDYTEYILGKTSTNSIEM
jgi:hypothetical protein